jgi:hypothetical protein
LIPSFLLKLAPGAFSKALSKKDLLTDAYNLLESRNYSITKEQVTYLLLFSSIVFLRWDAISGLGMSLWNWMRGLTGKRR